MVYIYPTALSGSAVLGWLWIVLLQNGKVWGSFLVLELALMMRGIS